MNTHRHIDPIQDWKDLHPVRLLWLGLWLLATLIPAAGDPFSDSIGDESRLLEIAERDQLLQEAVSLPQGRLLTADNLLREAQSILTLYEAYLRTYPEDQAALLLYGKFLRAVGRPHEAAIVFLRLDEMNPRLAVVKQQLGNLAAEEGDAVAAIAWFDEAIQLAPMEALYVFQKGVVLSLFGDLLVNTGSVSRSDLEKQKLKAFRQAVELDPRNRDFRARLAETHYDLREPDWEEALEHWDVLAQNPLSDNEAQVISLHRSRVLTELGRLPAARKLLESITLPSLEASRSSLEKRLGDISDDDS